MKKILFVIGIILPTAFCVAQTGFSARSMGLAGAYQGMSRGAEVSMWNPANLALPNAPHLTVDFLNIGTSLGNNSFSVSLYNQYFSQSYFSAHDMWDQAAKNAIIEEVPSDGLKLFSRTHITLLGVSRDNLALAVNSFAYVDLNLPQDLVAVPLEGLGEEPVDLTDIDGEAIAGTEIALSYAREIPVRWRWAENFTVGGSVKYYIGHAYAVIEEAGGTALSNADSIGVEGSYLVKLVEPWDDKGKTGHGFGLDLGAAVNVNKRLSFGLSLHNIFGSIKFKGCEVSEGSYSFHEPGLDQDEFDNFEAYFDSSTTETYDSNETLTYVLPKSFLLSGIYQLNEKITLEADYHQGLNNTAGSSTTPRLAVGAEFNYVKWLPTRLGLALGGVQGTTLACGFGLHFGAYQLDFGIAGQRGLFNHSKGVNFAFSQRLAF
jgi:hypothetical protein